MIILACPTPHPDVRFENLSAEHLVSLMEKGEADIALRSTGGELTGDTLTAMRLPNVTLGGRLLGGLLRREPQAGLDGCLKDHAVVACSGRVATLHFSIFFMSFVRGQRVATTSNSIPNMAGPVRAGLRVGLLPPMLGLTTPGLVLCVPPPVEIDSAWWLLASPKAHQQPRVRSFMAFAAGRIRQDKSGWLRN